MQEQFNQPPIPPAVVGLVEGIVYLTKTNQEFYRTYVLNKRGWF